jgi:hypothetical protein
MESGPNNRAMVFSAFLAATMVGGGTGVSLGGIVSNAFSATAPALFASMTYATTGIAILTIIVLRRIFRRSSPMP